MFNHAQWANPVTGFTEPELHAHPQLRKWRAGNLARAAHGAARRAVRVLAADQDADAGSEPARPIGPGQSLLPRPFFKRANPQPTRLSCRDCDADRHGSTAAPPPGPGDENQADPPRHRRRAAAAEGELGVRAGHRRATAGVRRRLRRRRRAPARLRGRAAADAPPHLPHASALGPQRRLRQPDLAGLDRRAAHARRHVGAAAAREDDEACSSR